MHRDLAHHGSKVSAPIVLNGRSVRTTLFSDSSLGSWNALLNKAKGERLMSPQQVARRTEDFSKGSRTIYPEFNNNEVKHKTRKISSKPGPEDPGNLLHILRKTGTIETVKNTKRKIFKDKLQTGEIGSAELPERKTVKTIEKKQENLESKIPGLSGNLTDRTRERPVEETPQRAATREKRVDHLKSANSVLPGNGGTRRPFQDRDEKLIRQSAQSPKCFKHLESTMQDQPYFEAPQKVDPNRQNHESYEDASRLHPFSKGKKVDYSEYNKKNVSQLFSPRNEAWETYQQRNGNMEALDVFGQGRRAIKQQNAQNNIINPPEKKDAARGSTMYSYRTYSSQIF